MSDSEERTNSQIPATPVNCRGPRGLGEKAARALGERFGANRECSGVEEESFLKQWFSDQGQLFDQEEWLSYQLVANNTAEHEVRYRRSDHRAIKKTLVGSFGNIPKLEDEGWILAPATPSQYLHRLALQNEWFGDALRLEGAVIKEGATSSIIWTPDAAGLSLVISQPWLDPADRSNQFPSVAEIDNFMTDLGFSSLISSLYGWQNSDSTLIVLDAKPDNFILTSAGILPIDLLLTEIET